MTGSTIWSTANAAMPYPISARKTRRRLSSASKGTCMCLGPGRGRYHEAIRIGRRTSSGAEGDPLRQWQIAAPVDGRGLPPHVGLPVVRSRFPPPPRLLLAAERAPHLPALLAGGGERAAVTVHGAARDQRAHQNAALERVADADAAIGGGDTIDQGAGDPALYEQPARARATLAGGPDRAKGDGTDGEVRIGIVQHDHAVVSSQLENGAPEPGGNACGDCRAGRDRSRERDQRHARIVA